MAIVRVGGGQGGGGQARHKVFEKPRKVSLPGQLWDQMACDLLPDKSVG